MDSFFWTVLVGYLTISTNVNCYHTRCRRHYYLPFSNTAHACTIAWCAQQFNSCCTKLFISTELWPQQATAELNYKI